MLTHLPKRSPARRSPVLWVLSVCLIAVLACSLGGGAAATSTPVPAPTQAPATEVAAATPAPQGPTVTIDITDNQFTPATLDLAAGTTGGRAPNSPPPHTRKAGQPTGDKQPPGDRAQVPV